jgi:hypothetical protein
MQLFLPSPRNSFPPKTVCEWEFERLMNMPRCLDCANYRIQDGFCYWCKAVITEKSAKKSMPCDGFVPAEKHHRVPDMKLVRVK